jgi:pilus assembly protein Flp/PilA
MPYSPLALSSEDRSTRTTLSGESPCCRRECRIRPIRPGGIVSSQWQAFWSDESGQGLVEYALIIALVAIGLIAILLILRNSIGDVFNNASEALQNAPANPYP